MPLLPISAIMPTLGRPERARRTVASLLAQDVLPTEIIIVDASAVPLEYANLAAPRAGSAAGPAFTCLRAAERGTAAQRNQGWAASTQPYVLFIDDDVDLEPGCLSALWQSMQADPHLGGCGVVITNQHYHPPGRLMRRVYRLLGCPGAGSLAGRCCGPALNFLPALDEADQADGAHVDWLNLCCTLYRRAALPRPPLLGFFHGYSLMEDAALALQAGREWRLAAPAAARVYHDTRPANYKDRAYAREKMEVVNRWFVMRCVMDRDHLGWDLRQLGLQLFMLAISLRSREGWRRFPAALAGKLAGFATVVLRGPRWRGYTNPTKP